MLDLSVKKIQFSCEVETLLEQLFAGSIIIGARAIHGPTWTKQGAVWCVYPIAQPPEPCMPEAAAFIVRVHVHNAAPAVALGTISPLLYHAACMRKLVNTV